MGEPGRQPPSTTTLAVKYAGKLYSLTLANTMSVAALGDALLAETGGDTRDHTHARMQAHTHAHMHDHTHACMTTRMHERTHARTHACTHARTHTRTHARTHACKNARTHTRMHARMHARTQARTHAHRRGSGANAEAGGPAKAARSPGPGAG